MLKLKLHYLGHLMRRADSLDFPDAGKDWKQEKRVAEECEMTGQYHLLKEHEFELTSGDCEKREDWRAAVHGVTKTQTQLSN